MLGVHSLKGSNAIISGASRGIGFAIATAFAEAGASKLTLVGRNRQALEVAKSSISSTNGAEVELREGDAGKRGFWQDLARDVKDVDILVNAAGITHSSLFVSTSAELIEDVYQTNLLGTTWACQSIAKAMIRQRRKAEDPGCIINVGSLLGLKGGKGSVAYAASKAGLMGLTRSLSAELGSSNIRVNVIVPGYIETQMTQAMNPNAHAEAIQSIPQKRFGAPEEVAHAAVFLATNRYCNNTVLNLDGGLSAT